MAKSFRFENVVPSAEDLLKPKQKQATELGNWNPLEHYLSIMFLRKQKLFLAPINNSIQNFLNKKHTNQGSNLHIYKNVKLGSFCVDNNTYGFELVFEDSVDWQYLKPSMLKKLMILTRDDFQKILLLSISSCSEENVKKGRVFAEPVLKVKIEPEYFGQKFVLLETNMYFDSYYQMLSSLQKITKDSFPMIQYIVKDNFSKNLPSYLLDTNFSKSLGKFTALTDVQFLNTQGKAVVSYLQNLEQHPRLDESQLFALKCALKLEFAVINGRSETGKTFLTSEIIRTMHENKESWGDVRSIIVICKTDKTLDVVLKSVIPYTQSIVRVGQSQTKDESLKQYSLMALRRELGKADKNSKCAKFYRKKLEVEALLGILHDLHMFFSSRSASSNSIFQNSLGNVASNNLDSIQQKEDSVSQEESVDPDLLITYKKINIQSWKNVKILDSLESLKKNCSAYEKLLEDVEKILYLPLDHPEKKNYFASFKSCMDAITKSKHDLEKRFFQANNEWQEIKREADREVMNGKNVTGLTVARISKMQSTLRSLEAPIVLVDEAESVSECLLVCSMPIQCKHLILIGDKSKPGVIDSLFKRVSSEGHICAKLTGQHLTQPHSTQPPSIAATSKTLTTIQNGSQSNTVIVSASQTPSTTADANCSSTVENSILLEPESASRTNSSSKPPSSTTSTTSRRSSTYKQSKVHECAKCSKTFASKSQYDMHNRVHNYKCEYCRHSFKRSDTLRKHVKKIHKKKVNLLECDLCKNKFATKHSVWAHLKSCSQKNAKRKTSS